ncbi:putative Zn-dependent peptidase [Geothermobacter ehrlichii]|uniref:Putative Zn-dependent peptidase n=1 Tax=Geothermobacter ehrlichii TaxID=213224 RepID=A0A5D3WLK2_9BACT|nr:pitrilysin family protein [Geothermobacter ehrlichii]TYO99321.1 putative Zn-dependent peptidase [Geothermobacter ehrlichii]
MQIESERLANGLRLVVVRMPHLHSVEMVCYVGVGGRNETRPTAGISHFVEHMLFRGCDGYPDSITLERAFEDIGGGANATTDVETTCYFSRLHPERLEEGARLFAALLRTPYWREMETERRIILEEAREDWNEQGEIINPDTLTNALLWPGTALGQPLIGTAESLQALASADLRGHHARYYAPANVVIVLAGRVEPDRALAAVDRAFGDWRVAGPDFTKVSLPTMQGPASVWVRDSASQINVQFALRLPWGREGSGAFPLRIWRRILSWGGGSRLMLRLREELGLTYHVEAALHLLADTGTLTIDLALQPDNLVRGVSEVLLQLRRMVEEPPAVDELARAVRNFRYDLDYSRDIPEEMAVRYGWGELVGYRRSIEQDLAAAEALTPAMMRQVAEEVVRSDRLALAVVGPWRPEQREAVERLLRQPF